MSKLLELVLYLPLLYGVQVVAKGRTVATELLLPLPLVQLLVQHPVLQFLHLNATVNLLVPYCLPAPAFKTV